MLQDLCERVNFKREEIYQKKDSTNQDLVSLENLKQIINISKFPATHSKRVNNYMSKFPYTGQRKEQKQTILCCESDAKRVDSKSI